MTKRQLEVVVLSDIHLGTYGCHAKLVADYLSEIKPKILILNGDIIDMWQFSKRYWPKSHNAVLKQIFNHLEKGTKVYYITGNHDDKLRKYSGILLGGLKLVDKLNLTLGGKRHLFLHGDIFDMIVQNNKWLSKIGGYSYDMLVLINRGINHILDKIGRERMSFSKKIKNSVKGAISFITKFEQTVIEYAAEKNIDVIACGHIHQPIIKTYATKEKTITYLNSGDWVENCTALEYNNGEWNLYHYEKESKLTKQNQQV